jgi:two-component system phosphate regulon sensor histidine kinase PhoR
VDDSLLIGILAAVAGAFALIAVRFYARLRGSRAEAMRLQILLARGTAQIEAMRGTDGAVLERLPDPVIVLDQARAVRRTNEAAREAFGAEIAAVLRNPHLRAAIDRGLSARVPQAADLSLPVPVRREVHASVVPLSPPMSDGGCLIVVLSDRTRERAIERMRADFVAHAGHELRTPLASLIGFIDTLRGPAADDPQAQQRFLQIMAEQAARMNRLIDDLLSLSRIELVEHQPPSNPVDLIEVIERLAAAFEPRLPERNAAIVLELGRNLPPVTGDADQLAQVVQNLLDNALRYGREGGQIRLIARQANQGVMLEVADDGPGIEAAHLPRLTERFYRVDQARSRKTGGTGLGLAIVKHIVNRHRGRLTIESQVGRGTTIRIWLPCAPQPAGAASAFSAGG